VVASVPNAEAPVGRPERPLFKGATVCSGS